MIEGTILQVKFVCSVVVWLTLQVKQQPNKDLSLTFSQLVSKINTYGHNYSTHKMNLCFSLSKLLFRVKIVPVGMELQQRMFQVLSVVHCVNDWYLIFNRCSSEQHPLKTVGKMEFWNWNNLAMMRGEFTFDLMGPVCQVESRFALHFYGENTVLKW